jgi:hypothetical protein
VISEILIKELVTPETMKLQIAKEGELCRRHKIPRPYEFTVSSQACVSKAVGTCPLRGHAEEEDSSDEGKIWIEQISVLPFF